MERLKTGKYFVYYLYYEDGTLADVGRSDNPGARKRKKQIKNACTFTMKTTEAMSFSEACALELEELRRFRPPLMRRLISSPGMFGKGKPLTEDHKKAILTGRIGYRHTEETRSKIGDANRGNRHTEETKLEMSRTRTGKKRSIEARQNISKSKMGHEVTDSTRAKLSEKHLGKKLSAITRSKISVANSGKPMSQGTKKVLGLWNLYQSAIAKQNRGERITKVDRAVLLSWEARVRKPAVLWKERDVSLLQSGYGHPWRLQGLDERTRLQVG